MNLDYARILCKIVPWGFSFVRSSFHHNTAHGARIATYLPIRRQLASAYARWDSPNNSRTRFQ